MVGHLSAHHHQIGREAGGPGVPRGRPALHEAEAAVSLDALRRLDPRAFDMVFIVFAPRLNGWLLGMGASPAVAEELVQEAFLRLVRHAGRLNDDTRVGA
ncbi:MAG: hypothetical protein EXR69_02510 [Myxococcales bacterium]|nr:hypothetical protein [Myxococcales bacterium]